MTWDIIQTHTQLTWPSQMSGQLSVPEAQYSNNFNLLCNIFGAQCGARKILNWARLSETESFLILYSDNVLLVWQRTFIEFMTPLQRRCLPTSPPEDVTTLNYSSLKTWRPSELCLWTFILLYTGNGKYYFCSLHMFCIIVFDIGYLVLHIVCGIKFSDVKCQSLIDNIVIG